MNSEGDIRRLLAGEMPREDEVLLTEKQAEALGAQPVEVRKHAYAQIRANDNGADYKRLKRTGRLR